MDIFMRDKQIARAYHQGQVTYPNPVKNGLVLWYDFKGRTNSDPNKATAQDLSGKNNHGVLLNFAYEKGSGYANGEVVFDPTDDGIQNAPTNTLFSDNSFYVTGEIAVKFHELTGATYVFGGAYGQPFSATMSRTEIVLRMRSLNSGGVLDNQYYTVAIPALETNKTYLLSFTVDYKTKVVKIYLDGVLVSESPPLSNIHSLITNSRTYLGREGFYTNTTSLSVSSFRLYNRVLTAEEILHNYEMEKERWSPTPVQKGLQLWYDFAGHFNSDASRTSIKDLSQTGNDGSLTNFSFDKGSGYKRKNGLVFDGVDDKVLVQNNPSITPTNAITLETTAYVGTDSTSTTHRMLLTWESAIYISFQTDANQPFVSMRLDGTQRTMSSDYAVVKGKPCHIVCTYDGATLSMYVDGELRRSNPYTGVIGHSTSSKVVGAYVGAGYPHKGGVFSARMYNRALTPAEITHNYNIEKEKWNL